YLARTLEALISRGALVLATSNYAPDSLMPNPLFHERFVPAIELITARFDVVSLGAGTDYRRAAAPHASTGFDAGSWTIDARLAGSLRGDLRGDLCGDLRGDPPQLGRRPGVTVMLDIDEFA